jgi:hypothetical protein
LKYNGSENFSLAAYLFVGGAASLALILPCEALLWQLFEQYFLLSDAPRLPESNSAPQKSQR